MGVASLIIGILSLMIACLALIPPLNLGNCIALPLALLGGVLGLADVISYKPPGQSKAAGVIGLIIAILVLLMGTVRLLVGIVFLGGM